MVDETRKAREARYTKRYRDAGLTQISAWVPEVHKASVLALCHRLRDEHLNSEAYRQADALGFNTEDQA